MYNVFNRFSSLFLTNKSNNRTPSTSTNGIFHCKKILKIKLCARTKTIIFLRCWLGPQGRNIKIIRPYKADMANFKKTRHCTSTAANFLKKPASLKGPKPASLKGIRSGYFDLFIVHINHWTIRSLFFRLLHLRGICSERTRLDSDKRFFAS